MRYESIPQSLDLAYNNLLFDLLIILFGFSKCRLNLRSQCDQFYMIYGNRTNNKCKAHILKLWFRFHYFFQKKCDKTY
uniref:Uncharacterized protein n=1 Tax=Solanum lycopersicum TaxID=4081 RepID=A0A3Q7HNQ8_SOLLC